jgi:RimJ/RimL family protein N-acetyltransferase
MNMTEVNMKTKMTNPFDKCPIYETENCTYRLVKDDDAEDLFIVYSDPITLSHMNNDNCKGEFRCASVDVMQDAIRRWQNDYERRTFLRWSIIYKNTTKAIGTIEIAPLPWGRWFFGKETPIGILRIDLLSCYEQETILTEIFKMMGTELANDFEVNQVIMKAPPNEPEKIKALITNKFHPYILADFPYKHYYKRSISRL